MVDPSLRPPVPSRTSRPANKSALSSRTNTQKKKPPKKIHRSNPRTRLALFPPSALARPPPVTTPGHGAAPRTPCWQHPHRCRPKLSTGAATAVTSHMPLPPLQVWDVVDPPTSFKSAGGRGAITLPAYMEGGWRGGRLISVIHWAWLHLGLHR